MHLLENIREAFRSINSNLLRTILTALIVSIGIMSLVGILTAIDAMKDSLNSDLCQPGCQLLRNEGQRLHQPLPAGRRAGQNVPAHQPSCRPTSTSSSSASEAQVGISAFIAGATEVKANGEKTNPNMQVVAGDENYLLIQSYNLGTAAPSRPPSSTTAPTWSSSAPK